METTVTMTCYDRKGSRVRDISVTLGHTYRIEPLSLRTTKNRGRVCTILEFEDHFVPSTATVRFHDTNRVGKVNISALVPAS